MTVRNELRRLYAALPFKQPVYELARRHVRLPASVYQHLHFRGVIDVRVDADRAFRMYHHGFQVENDLFWAGYGNGWEGTSLRLWARLAQHACTIFDIGANTGVYALAAKTMNPSAQVYAFEPVERIATRLANNVALNGYDIEVVIAGVSESTGEALLYEPKTQHAYSASLNPAMLAGKSDLSEKRIATTRMDDFAAERGLSSTDLFKIDVEKHEIEVLCGFGGLIALNRPTFLIEILSETLGEQVKALFSGHNYVFYEINEGVSVRQVTTLGSAERNYLICPREFASGMNLGESTFHAELSQF